MAEGVTSFGTFEFEEPFEATAGQILGASFEYFGDAPLSIAESSTNFGGTAAIYGPAGAENIYAWRGTEEMPMVRLNLDPNIVPTVPGEGLLVARTLKHATLTPRLGDSRRFVLFVWGCVGCLLEEIVLSESNGDGGL